MNVGGMMTISSCVHMVLQVKFKEERNVAKCWFFVKVVHKSYMQGGVMCA
jgi:hypothetical protein